MTLNGKPSLTRLSELQEKLGVAFTDRTLLELALVHSSYVNENPGATSGHNERLEFLGDAVLGLVMAEKLYQDYPTLTEGEMTRLRSVLVRRETLAGVAETIGLGDCLFMGRGEEASGGRSKKANLAGALEALIAAIYLDQGWILTTKTVLDLFQAELDRAGGREGAAPDFKSRLQEIIQSRTRMPPSYRLVEETGPDHDKVFTVEVTAGGEVLGTGQGKTKKTAETEAARHALEMMDNSFTG